MAQPFYSIIIPAKNEAKRLPITLIDVDRHLSKQDKKYEIIVALSPSEDNLHEILQRFERLIPNLKVIYLDTDLRKGGATLEAIKKATGEYLIFMEADNAVSITELSKAVPYIGPSASKKAKYHEVSELVIGSRYHSGSHHNPPEPISKKIFGRLFRLITRLCIVNRTDPNPKFFIIAKEVLSKITPRLKTTGWLLPLEIIANAKKMKIAPVEFPVFYSNDKTRRSEKSILKLKLEWWKIFFSKFFNREQTQKGARRQ
ncbi:MAG: hypothetical protein COU10_00765 [Candidatus Harrisonbacteria bacterium CG10_big_fil_rev_8_21_14_0_10_45_28]|uniref:Glycosyltransferase 2-like domain-containing protein n=1 Tax=Candidatus Harrisonbacteria bacterium CG10_big_fil_rev_8_21_14_0_10_45_28 TaxID=1974586 RepID=A0A2H0UP17_9BACT|nr:MAG: hypothetical protein COU10_00765 [Candidatus Harrisonbacteria bacterium CG10_big_fil_rev_8_21_14_0_10_45_28]